MARTAIEIVADGELRERVRSEFRSARA